MGRASMLRHNGWLTPGDFAEVERAVACSDPHCPDPHCVGGHGRSKPFLGLERGSGLPANFSLGSAEVPGLHAAAEALARGFSQKESRGQMQPMQLAAGGDISLEDWARRSDTRGAEGLSSASYFRGTTQRAGSGVVLGHCNIAPPPEIDASLQDLLAPLVAERVHDFGRLAPPNSLEVEHVFAAISAVSTPADSSNGIYGPGSHFASACRSLARHGFRRCRLVVDKLGVSIHCAAEPQLGQEAEQVDFPWSSISDVQDPRAKAGLQGCAVTLGVREPTRLFEAPSAALALVLRLPDRVTARRLADAALAFKAYEAQTALWNACGGLGAHSAAFGKFAKLLLDERGSAFWSLSGPEEAEYLEAAKTHVEPLGPVVEASAPESSCCHLCWC